MRKKNSIELQKSAVHIIRWKRLCEEDLKNKCNEKPRVRELNRHWIVLNGFQCTKELKQCFWLHDCTISVAVRCTLLRSFVPADTGVIDLRFELYTTRDVYFSRSPISISLYRVHLFDWFACCVYMPSDVFKPATPARILLLQRTISPFWFNGGCLHPSFASFSYILYPTPFLCLGDHFLNTYHIQRVRAQIGHCVYTLLKVHRPAMRTCKIDSKFQNWINSIGKQWTRRGICSIIFFSLFCFQFAVFALSNTLMNAIHYGRRMKFTRCGRHSWSINKCN